VPCSTRRVAQALNGTFARTIFTMGPGRLRRESRSLIPWGVVICLGLKSDGSTVVWGAGQAGQSGSPHCGQCDVPAPNTGFVAIAAGQHHSLGIKVCLLGDLDCDGDVDLSDLATLLAHYGMTSGSVYEDGDLDIDGDVDLSDLVALLAVYGTSCE
jgi:hypothetical protein